MKFDTCNSELSNLILLKTQKELYQCKIELLSYEKKHKDDTSNGSIGAKSLRDEGTKINSSCSQTSNSDGELVNIKIFKSLLLLTQKKLSEKVINESNTRVVVKSSLESILNRTKFDSRLLNLSNKIDLDITRRDDTDIDARGMLLLTAMISRSRVVEQSYSMIV